MRRTSSARTAAMVLMAGLLAACASAAPRRVGKAEPAPPTAATPPTEPQLTSSAPPPASTETPVTTTPATTAVLVPSLEWGACEDVPEQLPVECATLPVPLDHADPTGETIEIGLIRLPASGRRKGAILTNPGGPGGSGIEFLSQFALVAEDILGREVVARYDLVGFDPRGVGRSAPIDCVSDAWLDAHLYLDDTPDTPEEQAALDGVSAEFTQGCRDALGDSLTHYSTVDTARDMDLIRSALGDEKILFYGASYGSYLGALYATLYPQRTQAMVLDAAYSPAGDDPVTQIRTQLVGFEQAFANWVTWCDAKPSCELTGGAAARWDALAAKLDASPLTVGGREANAVVMRRATIETLYDPRGWARLATALAQAEGGDGSRILSLADEYHQRAGDGVYANIYEANRVIECASGFGTASIADPAAAAAELRAAAPRFGSTITAGDLTDICAALTGPAELATISADGSIPILVVGGRNDPATPYRWAEKMAGELNAGLLTFTGEGHVALNKSTCVADAAAAVLLDGTLPAPGTACDADPPTAAPAWWAEQPAEIEGVSLVDTNDFPGQLGLPSGKYADLLTSAADPATTVQRLIAAYEAAGWSKLAEADLPSIEGAKQLVFTKDDHLVAVTVIGPGRLSADELGPMADLVPEGSGPIIRLEPAV